MTYYKWYYAPVYYSSNNTSTSATSHNYTIYYMYREPVYVNYSITGGRKKEKYDWSMELFLIKCIILTVLIIITGGVINNI